MDEEKKNEVVSDLETTDEDKVKEKIVVKVLDKIKSAWKVAVPKIKAVWNKTKEILKPILIKVGAWIKTTSKNIFINLVKLKNEDKDEKRKGFKEFIESVNEKIKGKSKLGKLFADIKKKISEQYNGSFLHRKNTELLFAALCINVIVLAIGQEGNVYLACAKFANFLFSTLGDYAVTDSLREFFEAAWKFIVSKTPFLLICGLAILIYKHIQIGHEKIKNERYKEKHFDEYKKAIVNNNEFRERLFLYLEEDKTNRCLIVTGEWGSGKTYQINEFFEEYEKYNNMRKYTISCFAIENREQLAELLKEEMKAKDDSFQKKAVEILKHIPLLGELVASIYDGIYSFNFLKNKDVIVLEDVERVVFSLPSESKDGVTDSDRESGQRISIIAGFANDLLERHKKKVIIVCNRNEIRREIFNDILYSKLAAELVNIPNNFERIFETILEKYKDSCNETVFEWLKIVFGVQDRKNPISHNIPFLFSLAGIKNIRDIEKVIGGTVLYLKLVEKTYGKSMNINKGEIRLRIEDYIYSFVFYHILAELHMSLTVDRLDVNYTELCLEDDILRDSKVMRKVCMAFPTDKLFVSVHHVEDIMSQTYFVNHIDFSKCELRDKPKYNLSLWNGVVQRQQRKKTLKYSFEEVKYHIYLFMYRENSLSDAGKDTLLFPDLEAVGVDESFEENIPELLKIIVDCASTLNDDTSKVFMEYTSPIYHFLQANNSDRDDIRNYYYHLAMEKWKMNIQWNEPSLYQKLIPEKNECDISEFAQTVTEQREAEKEKEMQETNNV